MIESLGESGQPVKCLAAVQIGGDLYEQAVKAQHVQSLAKLAAQWIANLQQLLPLACSLKSNTFHQHEVRTRIVKMLWVDIKYLGLPAGCARV
jgi:hypothetical protein